jgi:hypothetical protein
LKEHGRNRKQSGVSPPCRQKSKSSSRNKSKNSHTAAPDHESRKSIPGRCHSAPPTTFERRPAQQKAKSRIVPIAEGSSRLTTADLLVLRSTTEQRNCIAPIRPVFVEASVVPTQKMSDPDDNTSANVSVINEFLSETESFPTPAPSRHIGKMKCHNRINNICIYNYLFVSSC